MAEAKIYNVQAFEPYGGGDGVRFTAGTTSTARAIPGLEGGVVTDKTRVVVTNPNGFSVFIRFGNSGVAATLNSFELIKDSSQLLKPQYIGSQAIWIAAITESASALPISVCAGTGV